MLVIRGHVGHGDGGGGCRGRGSCWAARGGWLIGDGEEGVSCSGVLIVPDLGLRVWHVTRRSLLVAVLLRGHWLVFMTHFDELEVMLMVML